MGIGLDGIQAMIDSINRLDKISVGAKRIGIINVAAAFIIVELKQFLLFMLPPRFLNLDILLLLTHQLRPGWPKGLLTARLCYGMLVQLTHQSVGLTSLNYKSKVQIIRRLTDQIHFMLFKDFKSAAQLMQDSTNMAAQQTYSRYRLYNLNFAKLRQLFNKRFLNTDKMCIEGRIQRNGDIRFRSGHQVDRQPILFEDGKGLCKKADTLPHTQRLHAHQYNIIAHGNGFNQGLIL